MIISSFPDSSNNQRSVATARILSGVLASRDISVKFAVMWYTSDAMSSSPSSAQEKTRAQTLMILAQSTSSAPRPMARRPSATIAGRSSMGSFTRECAVKHVT